MAKAIYSKTVFVTGGGAVEAGAEYNVVSESTGLAAVVYEDREGLTVKTQPAFADANGKVEFYIDAGLTFRVAVEGGTGTVTDRYQQGVLFGDQSGEVGRFVNELKSYTVASDLTVSGQSLVTEDASKIAQLGGSMSYGGTANAITLAAANTTAITSLSNGQEFSFIPTVTNTGVMTVEIDDLPIIDMKTANGSNIPAGYMLANEKMVGSIQNGNELWMSRRVESGSNANGEYTRWEDGTIEQTRIETIVTTVSTVVGAIFASGTIGPRDYPLVMASLDYESKSISDSEGSSYNWIGTVNGSTQGVTAWSTFAILDATSSDTDDMTVNFYVKGKWY